MAARGPQATTGIVLVRNFTRGQYEHTPPGGGLFWHTWPDDTHLDAISAELGLTNGYWLRSCALATTTEYTWVQL